MARKSKVRFYKNRKGEFSWRITSSNGNKKCTPGEGFGTLASAIKNFKSVATDFRTGNACVEGLDADNTAKILNIIKP